MTIVIAPRAALQFSGVWAKRCFLDIWQQIKQGEIAVGIAWVPPTVCVHVLRCLAVSPPTNNRCAQAHKGRGDVRVSSCISLQPSRLNLRLLVYVILMVPCFPAKSGSIHKWWHFYFTRPPSRLSPLSFILIVHSIYEWWYWPRLGSWLPPPIQSWIQNLLFHHFPWSTASLQSFSRIFKICKSQFYIFFFYLTSGLLKRTAWPEKWMRWADAVLRQRPLLITGNQSDMFN